MSILAGANAMPATTSTPLPLCNYSIVNNYCNVPVADMTMSTVSHLSTSLFPNTTYTFNASAPPTPPLAMSTEYSFGDVISSNFNPAIVTASYFASLCGCLLTIEILHRRGGGVWNWRSL